MPLAPDIDFAELCKKLRKKSNLTQREMAECLGAPLRSYQRWEYNTRKPSAIFAARILALRDKLKAK